jgi:uncharacterized protein YbjQ (UPF0145 family)
MNWKFWLTPAEPRSRYALLMALGVVILMTPMASGIRAGACWPPSPPWPRSSCACVGQTHHAEVTGHDRDTTPSVEGQKIVEYHGIVVGEAILGANVFRDIFAGITDIIGGRSGAYEEELGKARTVALEEMEQRAHDMGANAVVGVDLDYEVINNMLMVSASGTAVRLG